MAWSSFTRTVERPPAVAGLFYPADPTELARDVDLYVASASPSATVSDLRALVAPHAGYAYSGPIAGTAYRALRSAGRRFRRVVVLGPSHRVAFAGIAAPTHERFTTPLGSLDLDVDAIEALVASGAVRRWDPPHAEEHGLEVHLPFLQRVLGEVLLIPLVVGEAEAPEVVAVLEALEGEGTLIVLSSDLSHYEDAVSARRHDDRTAEAIERLAWREIGPRDACGCRPLAGLLEWARRRQLEVRRLDLRHSGDTAGPADRVVGYGAFVVASRGDDRDVGSG